MSSHRVPLARLLPSSRPLRPPNTTKQLPSPRLFTQNSQLLLVSGVTPRPHLPFLHPATGGRSSTVLPRKKFQRQLFRLLTTERKLYLKDQLWNGARYTLYGWAALGLIGVMAFGMHNEILERQFPSPPEWRMITRINYRSAKSQEQLDPNGTGLTDWSSTGNAYRLLLGRLENPSIDGQALRPVLQDEGDICVAGLGKAGLDISAKSEPWRRGYYDCLMGAAKAAENRDGWVCDTTRNIAFPPEVVIGPSNPRPKPVPYGAKSPPLEENCVPAFEPAQTYYMKILTTHGFSARQRLEAALAYADWLDFKGLSATAEEMYDWGVDIAMGALPEGINNVIDIKTGVINSDATYISLNVLLATTSLAFHHARNNNLAAALPIFLSVLRARRRLPAPISPSPVDHKSRNASTVSRFFDFARSLITAPSYPLAPPTGDEFPFRTPLAMCEEAGIMSHIGEILFASGSASSVAKAPSKTAIASSIPSKTTAGDLQNRQSGLSWTRDAVDVAEATLASANKDDEETRDKCSECLAVGMDNWSVMVAKMLKDERQAKHLSQQNVSGSWLWGSGGTLGQEGRVGVLQPYTS